MVAFVIFALFGAITLIVWFGARMLVTGHIDRPAFTQFCFVTAFVAGAIAALPEIISQIQKAVNAILYSFQKFDRCDMQYRRSAAQAFCREKAGETCDTTETGNSEHASHLSYRHHLHFQLHTSGEFSFHLTRAVLDAPHLHRHTAGRVTHLA